MGYCLQCGYCSNLCAFRDRISNTNTKKTINLVNHIVTYICMIEAKPPKFSPSSPPKLALLRTLHMFKDNYCSEHTDFHKKIWWFGSYIPVMLEFTHWTPCQPSKHGSPPANNHPKRGGKPRAAYRLFIAKTVTKNLYTKINNNNNNKPKNDHGLHLLKNHGFLSKIQVLLFVIMSGLRVIHAN